MQRVFIIAAFFLVLVALVASFAVIGSASPTDPAPNDEQHEQIIKGTITDVDPYGDTFVMKVENQSEDEGVDTDDREVTLRVNENTQYMLNGEEATRDETLVEGYRAQVVHQDKLATQVDATSPRS